MNGNFDYNALLDTAISNKLAGSGKADDKNDSGNTGSVREIRGSFT